MITEYGTVTITKEDGRRALAIEAIEWAKGQLEKKLGSLGK